MSRQHSLLCNPGMKNGYLQSEVGLELALRPAPSKADMDWIFCLEGSNSANAGVVAYHLDRRLYDLDRTVALAKFYR